MPRPLTRPRWSVRHELFMIKNEAVKPEDVRPLPRPFHSSKAGSCSSEGIEANSGVVTMISARRASLQMKICVDGTCLANTG